MTRAPLLALALLAALAASAPAGDLAEAEALRALEARDAAGARRAVAALGGRPPGSSQAEEAARRAGALLLAADAIEALGAIGGAPGPYDARAQERLLLRAERLATRTRPADLPLLRALEGALGELRHVVSPLVRAAYRAIQPGLPRAELMRLAAQAHDPRARDLAVAAIARRAAALRLEVLEGGDLTGEEQADVADPALVALLIDRLADRPGHGATDRLPADAVARGEGAATALHALASIEAAALPALEAAAREGRPGAREALEAVEAAVARRLRRHPASTWCSAAGAAPALTTRTTCPAPCARDVSMSALFCPACGAHVRVVCVTCGALTPAGSAHCSSCGARAVDPLGDACTRCRAALPREGRHCARCGARRPDARR